MRALSNLLLVVGASLITTVILGSNLSLAEKVADLTSQWQRVADGVDEINVSRAAEESASSATAGTIPEEAASQVVANPDKAQLTSTLIAWISSQSEAIVEEMEAIAKQNAEAQSFSVVNYLRYLTLYDNLKVIAYKSRDLEELKWVSKKAKVFASIYQSAMEYVAAYLIDLDSAMTKIEEAEPKSKQVAVSNTWKILFQTIRYIATHAPRGSTLAQTATDMLATSPNGTSDRMRSTRYQLKTRAFNR